MLRILACLLIASLGSAAAHAADGPGCPHLLTVDEVAAAVGSPVKLTTAATNGRIAAGPAVNKPIEVCSWQTETKQLGVNIVYVPMLEPPARAQGLKAVEFPLGQLRAMHFSEERRDFGGVHCSSLSPAKAAKVPPLVTGCIGDANGTAVYVGISSHASQPSFDQVKQLYDAVAARM